VTRSPTVVGGGRPSHESLQPPEDVTPRSKATAHVQRRGTVLGKELADSEAREKRGPARPGRLSPAASPGRNLDEARSVHVTNLIGLLRQLNFGSFGTPFLFVTTLKADRPGPEQSRDDSDINAAVQKKCDEIRRGLAS
jgi:hypothetical protein